MLGFAFARKIITKGAVNAPAAIEVSGEKEETGRKTGPEERESEGRSPGVAFQFLDEE